MSDTADGAELEPVRTSSGRCGKGGGGGSEGADASDVFVVCAGREWNGFVSEVGASNVVAVDVLRRRAMAYGAGGGGGCLGGGGAPNVFLAGATTAAELALSE